MSETQFQRALNTRGWLCIRTLSTSTPTRHPLSVTSVGNCCLGSLNRAWNVMVNDSQSPNLHEKDHTYLRLRSELPQAVRLEDPEQLQWLSTTKALCYSPVAEQFQHSKSERAKSQFSSLSLSILSVRRSESSVWRNHGSVELAETAQISPNRLWLCSMEMD